MQIHSNLEPGPQQHIGPVDVAISYWDLSALQLECEMLVQPYTKQNAKAIVSGVNECFNERLTETKSRLEDLGEPSGHLRKGAAGEEFSQERIFG